MQLIDGTLIVSATDLVGFLECDHLVTLELARTRGEVEKPFRDDPQLDLIRRRGFDHEQAYIALLREQGRDVLEISRTAATTPAELLAAQDETVEAMRAGADVIFQATLFDGRWRGHPDFLLRRDDRPSVLGDYSYDVADTKLARRVKAAAIVQMCVYGDLLEKVQGIPPETVAVVTGDRASHVHQLADYAAYYRAAKRRFEERIAGPAADTYPEPVDHCRVCSWWSMCVDRRRADDHLSLVANITRSNRRRLVDAGVGTLEALAGMPENAQVAKLPPRILDRLRQQASLQLGYRRDHVLRYELIPPDEDVPGRGLAALPEPSPLDVFFDIEADPWAIDDGLEYLLGWAEIVDGAPVYHAIWAHDRASEKAAFEGFVDLVQDRLERDPGMHVYHYGGYESGALKRLMQRHATREDEVDELLRGRTLVNLYDHVVRNAIRASVESYSIKKIEKFYLPEREGGITDAGFSVVEYERWMETRDATILDAIAAYNRDDCVSTAGLRDWLEARRIEAAPLFPDGVVPRPEAVDGEAPPDLAAQQAETRAREDALREGVPADRAERTPEEQGRWLLAALLDWHRREAKPQWWDHFRLRDASIEDLIADASALGGLEFVEDLGPIARSRLHRYRFDPSQETKLHAGKSPIDPATGEGAGEIVALDPLLGTLDLKRNPMKPHPRGLIPSKPYGPEPMRGALGRLADHVIARGIEGPGPYRAVRELILGRPPRATLQPEGAPLVGRDETPLDAARRLVLALDASVLPIQGPPGTGKTYTGARMAIELVAAGKRVGVTAQSHRVIANFLEAVVEAAAEDGRRVRVAQRGDADEVSMNPGVERATSNEEVAANLASATYEVVGGTSWLWARDDMADSLDVLFVDEAGQLSLATVCSVGGAARSLVLLGDPNQLPQVSEGTHPEGAEASALEHLLEAARTIAPDRGLFLETTYRLHPAVNDFVSDAFYDGRLMPDGANATQDLAGGPPVGGTGVRFVGLPHAGGRNRSREEAEWVVAAIEALRGRPWTDRKGNRRVLDVPDVLVVAPYNAQVAEIATLAQQRLGALPNVGTVDKFQGREAPVAIYSMTTSSPEDAPRDLEFLYSGNRLNVAISRARGLAVLVASPDLLRVACRTPEQMRLVNAFCLFVEMAAKQLQADAAAAVVAPVSATEAETLLTLGL
ncbi:MAG TPA: TM0106 family RecB-like putative nuclease [Candidatus Limnocylindrales bacterium]|nr:TM0106 family RecB-like putative nuclease [Candidatus Limnocylindrales bacterium]